MQLVRIHVAVATLALLASAHPTAQSQPSAPASCERTRAEARADCREFLRNFRWDEAAGDYVPSRKGKSKGSVTPPEGVMTRAEVRAERDRFLSANRWNEQASQWEPVAGAPRELSTLSREQMRKEAAAFVRTHVWDEESATYVKRKAKTK